jgi:hypothetical protein
VSRPCYQFDEDIHRPIILRLRRADPEVKMFTARQAGLLHSADDRVLEIAAENRRILVSHDARTIIAVAKDRIASSPANVGSALDPASSAV